MMNERGIMTVVCGPSGVGKSTVLHGLFAKRKGICFSVSATTRKPRPGEKNGADYFFVSREDFDEMASSGELLEYAEYAGNKYGTPRGFIYNKLEQGTDVILDIEIQGARQVRKRCPEAAFVFIAPPSVRVLEKRLRGRGTEDEDTIRKRLETARGELAQRDFFDYLVVNSDAGEASEKLAAIITAEKCKTSRMADIKETFR